MNARTDQLLIRLGVFRALDAAELRNEICALDAKITELQRINTELNTQLRELRALWPDITPPISGVTYTIAPTFATLHDDGPDPFERLTHVGE